MKNIFRSVIMTAAFCLLMACAMKNATPLREQSELDHGANLLEKGYYKSALQTLIPAACNGNAKAQYAIGYLYYYGYGVAQDTNVGYLWIKLAADQNDPSAKVALQLISQDKNDVKPLHAMDKKDKNQK